MKKPLDRSTTYLNWQKSQMNLKIDQQKLFSLKDGQKIILKKNEQNFTDNITSMNRHVESAIRRERKKQNKISRNHGKISLI